MSPGQGLIVRPSSAVRRYDGQVIEVQGSPLPWAWYATNVLQTLGRVEEAVVATRKAQALDPRSPMRNYAVGQALYFARHYDEAEVHLQRLRELYPDFPLTYIYLAQIASLQRRHAAAIAAAEKAHAVYVGEGGLSAILGYVYARAGEEAGARALLRELGARGREQPSARRINPFHEAYIRLGLGEHVQALTAFEQAYEDRIMYMAWLGINQLRPAALVSSLSAPAREDGDRKLNARPLPRPVLRTKPDASLVPEVRRVRTGLGELLASR
jgi:tetratricopeptide (TPR) repeat protein